MLLACPAVAHADTSTLRLAPQADTYVDGTRPERTFATSTRMTADAEPVSVAYLRFDVSALAGRRVLGARLRLHQADASKHGGRVFAISSTSWPEALTFDARPPVDGPLLGTFGAVAPDTWYELEIGAGSINGGVLALAIDSPSTNGSRWATRESITPPELVVTVEEPTPPPAAPDADTGDGVTTVAAASAGSSEPTAFTSNRHLARTAGGRLLAVHGSHASGVQLAWRDPNGPWRTTSAGATNTGAILSGTGTGDWPASIVIARDAAGGEHAWVVWGGDEANANRPVQLARLADLDGPDGPTVGAPVTVDAAGYRADLAFETGTDGVTRGALVWTRRIGSTTTYELVTAWFSDLVSDAPAIHDRVVVETSGSAKRFGTLVPTGAGLRLLARSRVNSGALAVFAHPAGAPLASWSPPALGPVVSPTASPAGVALAGGDLLAVAEQDTTAHTSLVVRFPAAGGPAVVEATLPDFAQPTIATDGVRAWVAGVQASTGSVVSRELTSAGWTTTDRLEIDAATTGPLAWPNLLRATDGRLRLLAEGPGTTIYRGAVVAFQRPL